MRELGARLLQLQRGKEGLASARPKPLIDLALAGRFLLRIGTAARHRAARQPNRALALQAELAPLRHSSCIREGSFQPPRRQPRQPETSSN